MSILLSSDIKRWKRLAAFMPSYFYIEAEGVETGRHKAREAYREHYK